MTDTFRCGECERLLDTPASLAAGNCGLHPRKHEFAPDPHSVDCLECGFPFAFGALHVEPEVAEPVDHEPDWVCRVCWHDAHDGRCAAKFGRGYFAVPCNCEVAA